MPAVTTRASFQRFRSSSILEALVSRTKLTHTLFPSADILRERALSGKNELCSFVRSLAYVEQYSLAGVFILRYLTMFLPGGQLLSVTCYGRFKKNGGPLFLPGLAWYCSTYDLTPPGWGRVLFRNLLAGKECFCVFVCGILPKPPKVESNFSLPQINLRRWAKEKHFATVLILLVSQTQGSLGVRTKKSGRSFSCHARLTHSSLTDN